eukprot:2334706-Rhodomonas_salina.3
MEGGEGKRGGGGWRERGSAGDGRQRGRGGGRGGEADAEAEKSERGREGEEGGGRECGCVGGRSRDSEEMERGGGSEEHSTQEGGGAFRWRVWLDGISVGKWGEVAGKAGRRGSGEMARHGERGKREVEQWGCVGRATEGWVRAVS